MKRQIMGLLVGMAFLVAAAPVLAEEKPLAKPDVLTEEEVFTSQKLSSYDTIVIRDLKLEGAELTNIDDEEMPKFEAMKPMLARTVTDSLEMELKLRKLFKTILKNGTPQGKAIILEGSFTEFNGGNRAARFWVGFGAGKTYLKVKGQLIDAETGKQLATFEDRETGYKGVASLESFDGLFPHQAKSLGENIANFIQKLY
ncbi:DUF4410 domain-containing protein [Geomobilimonas luticola]|uniref:DUF4410 domain-containing protein n=1 Tax=Geomobilimonas luticola TaxID=1114878 RepID=A0ABS5SG93_9BACT|nr:DUF4410 domain-containing protein [Geomobilimonas luticola]MBT0654373.1 DUF4410 domain-containing protein [Geomobilimonas luticola]